MARKGKGSAFERELCKRLSLWWTKGKDEDVFWRTSQSGGRATTRSQKGKRTAGSYGDITATDKRGEPFTDFVTLELKRGYSKHTIFDILDRNPGRPGQQKLEEWIQQAKESASQAGSFSWMIILKRDQREPIVMVPDTVFPFLIPYLHTTRGCMTLGIPMREIRYVGKKKEHALHAQAVLLFHLSDFLESVTAKDIREIMKDL